LSDKNNASLPAPNMESNIGDEPLAEEKTAGLDTRVNIIVTSYRKRNHDPDGISAKAVIDGLVRFGLLPDDSAKEVRKVTFQSHVCKKGEEEKTIIELVE